MSTFPQAPSSCTVEIWPLPLLLSLSHWKCTTFAPRLPTFILIFFLICLWLSTSDTYCFTWSVKMDWEWFTLENFFAGGKWQSIFIFHLKKGIHEVSGPSVLRKQKKYRQSWSGNSRFVTEENEYATFRCCCKMLGSRSFLFFFVTVLLHLQTPALHTLMQQMSTPEFLLADFVQTYRYIFKRNCQIMAYITHTEDKLYY